MSIYQSLRYSVAFSIDSISNIYTFITIHDLKPWVFFAFKTLKSGVILISMNSTTTSQPCLSTATGWSVMSCNCFMLIPIVGQVPLLQTGLMVIQLQMKRCSYQTIKYQFITGKNVIMIQNTLLPKPFISGKYMSMFAIVILSILKPSEDFLN